MNTSEAEERLKTALAKIDFLERSAKAADAAYAEMAAECRGMAARIRGLETRLVAVVEKLKQASP